MQRTVEKSSIFALSAQIFGRVPQSHYSTCIRCEWSKTKHTTRQGIKTKSRIYRKTESPMRPLRTAEAITVFHVTRTVATTGKQETHRNVMRYTRNTPYRNKTPHQENIYFVYFIFLWVKSIYVARMHSMAYFRFECMFCH